MAPFGLRRRRSDAPDFLKTDLDIDALAEEIFGRYAGEQRIVIDGTPSMATFFRREYCPEFRVMRLAGRLALSVNRLAENGGAADALTPMRVTVHEIMLAALLHDLGKQHEDCAPFITLLEQTDLRVAVGAPTHKEYLLGIIRDVHCRKGPCMIDRLADAGRAELSNPFIATVARRHGDDYETNRCTKQGCWWASEINVVTIADDYDALMSAGPERAYRAEHHSVEQAAALLWRGAERGRYERRIARTFIENVLAFDLPTGTEPHQPTA